MINREQRRAAVKSQRENRADLPKKLTRVPKDQWLQTPTNEPRIDAWLSKDFLVQVRGCVDQSRVRRRVRRRAQPVEACNMSRYRKIEVRTWGDEKFRSLSAMPHFYLFAVIIPIQFSMKGAKNGERLELAWQRGKGRDGYSSSACYCSDSGRQGQRDSYSTKRGNGRRGFDNLLFEIPRKGYRRSNIECNRSEVNSHCPLRSGGAT